MNKARSARRVIIIIIIIIKKDRNIIGGAEIERHIEGATITQLQQKTSQLRNSTKERDFT